MNADKVIKVCGRCNGTGYTITGGHQIMCPDCESHGHTLVNNEIYYRVQLHWKQKNHRENEKVKCPGKNNALIARYECLDLSASKAFPECKNCEAGLITKKLLL